MKLQVTKSGIKNILLLKKVINIPLAIEKKIKRDYRLLRTELGYVGIS